MTLKSFIHHIRHPSKFWYGVAVLSGSIIGLGTFGIPFVFAKTGFGLGSLYLLAMTCLVTFSYLLYGEIVLRTHNRHQLVGYVKKYLGHYAYWIAQFNFWVAVFGFTTATLIVNGQFFSKTLSFFHISLSPNYASIIMLVIVSYVVYKGLRLMSRIDAIMVFLFFVLIGVIGSLSISNLEIGNYVFATGRFSFLPFGVVMFALMGLQGIPLTREVLIGKENILKKVIIVGTIVPAVLYFIFSFIIIGISGEGTSTEAIFGIASHICPIAVFIGSLFGFLASTTIFLSVATSFKESIWQDLKIRQQFGFLLMIIPSYVLFQMGVTNFINLIGLVGAVSGGINMILLIFTYVEAKSTGNRIPEYSINVSNKVLYLLMAIFFFGAIYTIIS